MDLFGLRAAEVSKLARDTIFATKANDGKKHGKMLFNDGYDLRGNVTGIHIFTRCKVFRD